MDFLDENHCTFYLSCDHKTSERFNKLLYVSIDFLSTYPSFGIIRTAYTTHRPSQVHYISTQLHSTLVELKGT